MRYAISSILLLLLGLSASAQDIKKNNKWSFSLDIGASAYSFLDGRGLDIDEHWYEVNVFNQFSDWPYMVAAAKYERHSGSISYESYQQCFICDYFVDAETPGGNSQDRVFDGTEEEWREFTTGFLEGRGFRQITVSYGYAILATKRWEIQPSIGIAHRRSTAQVGDGEWTIEEWLWHGGPVHDLWMPKIHFRAFNDFGAIGRLNVRYNFLPRWSVAVKGEYLRMSDAPHNQIGIGATVGFRL